MLFEAFLTPQESKFPWLNINLMDEKGEPPDSIRKCMGS